MHPDRRPVEVEQPGEIADDPRWDLLRDLAARAGVPWSGPIRITADSPSVGLTGSWKAPPPLAYEVNMIFDARVSLKALVATLRALWPLLSESGVVRRSRNRALGSRKIELLRFVCLEDNAMTQTWPARWNDWNALVTRNSRDRRTGWKRRWTFRDVRALRTMCHDAEEQVTGSRHGLGWFYDPRFRAGRYRPDVEDRIREMGIEVVHEKGETQHGKARTR